MGSVRQFTISLEKFGWNIEKVVGQLQRRGAFVIMSDVVKGSPVDTGRFRASWVIGVGVKNEGVAEKGPRSAVSARTESLLRLRALTPATVTGKAPVIISNNLPYATRLADGHSTQAPSGWVEAAVARAQRELEVVNVNVREAT